MPDRSIGRHKDEGDTNLSVELVGEHQHQSTLRPHSSSF